MGIFPALVPVGPKEATLVGKHSALDLLGPGKFGCSSIKNASLKGWGYNLVVECLPSMDEILGSIPSTTEKKKKTHLPAVQS
jgi:hypothetical protein